ncbi:probable signal peptidase complex subunit 2 [Galendromus occidentalis]|uniref:Signal peptidase complex subunit 2 n=1 Tax=Galendromus occidentalis TaxID=34638 RepID=A0AAJ6QX06_9ACAR|nr:probable signal peptidase complex subunit 2 [Galendromus occidentalis]
MCQADPQEPVKVEKWDGAAVRNALDDEIRQILTKEYKYEENFQLPDGRLFISLLAVGAAGWALLWDWWHPFPASREVLVLCVVSYFLLMGALTLYTKFIEKGVFVVAKKKDEVGLEPAKVFKARSQLERFDDIYKLELSMHTEGDKSKKSARVCLEKSIASWFDSEGTLRKDLLRKDVDKLHRSVQDASSKKS